MKILNIITSLGDGGAEATLYKILSNNKNHHDHFVICLMDKGKYGEKLINNNIKLTTLNLPRGKITLRAIFILFKTIKKISPDVVQTWLYHADFIGGLISKIIGIKKIFWNIRTSEYFSKNISFKTKLIIKINSYLSYFIPNKIIYCSSRSIKIHEEIGFVKKSFLIRNGFDHILFKEDIVKKNIYREKFNISKDDFVIGFISRFDPIKNHQLLIDSIELLTKDNKIKNVKCIFVGKNIKTNKLINASINIKKLKNFFILLDQQENIFDYMNILDLHVLPSDGEGFPNVVAESMCCSIINIARDVGDSSIIISDNNLIFNDNTEELSQLLFKMKKIKENQIDKWLDMKNNVRKNIITNYSIKKMINEYYSLWLIK